MAVREPSRTEIEHAITELLRDEEFVALATLVTDRAEIDHAIQLSLAQFTWAAETNLFNGVKGPEESQQVFFRIDPDMAVWADNRVRMMWRVMLDFDADSSHITDVRPYRDAFAARR